MNWHKEIHDAGTPEALLSVVNEYLLAYPEAYWSWIPREVRPRLVATVDELHAWHRRLADRLARVEAPNIRMQDLCVFFLQASARAIELADRPASSNDGDARRRQA